ncbi:hypothetical protein HBIMPC_27830 [Chitinophaga sp. 212800010-3]|nr:hypothetical protein [Chitinophaga sp. 212800010-3]
MWGVFKDNRECNSHVKLILNALHVTAAKARSV